MLVGYLASVVTPVWENETATILLSAALVGALRTRVSRRRSAAPACPPPGAVGRGGAGSRACRRSSRTAHAGVGHGEPALAAGLPGDALRGRGRPAGRPARRRLGAGRGHRSRGGARNGSVREPCERRCRRHWATRPWTSGTGSTRPARSSAPRWRGVALPGPDSERAVTYVTHDGEPVAAIVHDPSVLEDPWLRDAVASATRLAAANSRLQAEVRARVADLEASRRRILDARDDERTASGAPSARRSRAAPGRGVGGSSGAAGHRPRHRTRASESTAPTSRSGEPWRSWAGWPRASTRASCPSRGCGGPSQSLVERLPVRVEVAIDADRLPSPIEAAAYFVCAEALANVVKYASASRVRVSVIADEAARQGRRRGRRDRRRGPRSRLGPSRPGRPGRHPRGNASGARVPPATGRASPPRSLSAARTCEAQPILIHGFPVIRKASAGSIGSAGSRVRLPSSSRVNLNGSAGSNRTRPTR